MVFRLISQFPFGNASVIQKQAVCRKLPMNICVRTGYVAVQAVINQ